MWMNIMPNGYTGRLLRVDLSTGCVEVNSLDEEGFGTSGSVEALEEIGDLPIKNWLQGRWI